MVIRLSERVCCDPDDPRDCAERAACEEVGESGHTFCGVCPEHLIPRHRCGCSARPSTDPWDGKRDMNGDTYAEHMRKFNERQGS